MNETNPSQQPSMRDNIVRLIENGQVKMRPKWKYIVRAAAVAAWAVLVALTALYIASFTVFMLRQTGVWFAPGFGLQGLGVFLKSLPWVLVAVAVVFMGLLEILIRRYSFVYGRPFMYSALGVIVLVIAGGIVIGFTPLHEALFERAETGRLPVAGLFYERFGESPNSITVGKITFVGDAMYKIQARHLHVFNVFVTSSTFMPPGGVLKVNDVIVVLGERHDDNIEAIGIQRPASVPPPSFSNGSVEIRLMPAQ